MVPFYSTIQRFIDNSGRIIQPWIAYLQQFTIAPPDFISITVGASPFSYVAKEPGNVYASGGTVSDISLKRGVNTISVAANTTNPRMIPVGINDTVIVTYTVLPTIKFVPSYGQNTTS